MHRQLQEVLGTLAAARVRLRKLSDATAEADWNVRVDPNRWSVAECVAHLNLTSKAYEPVLRRALDDARARGGGAPRHYRRTFFGWMISATTGPVPGIGAIRFGRVKTTPAFVPTGDLPRRELVAEFERWQDTLVELAREADGLPLQKAMVQSLFNDRVRYDCYSAFLIVARHQHRHLAQAERVNDSRTARR